MRLGILTFGTAALDTTTLDALGDRDVDLVRGEAAITDLASAKTEAERIARADCDGVALVIGDDARALHATHAAQFLGVPLLVVAPPGDAFFAACGALAEVGIHFERFFLTPPAYAEGEWRMQKSQEEIGAFSRRLHADEVMEWLEEHSKTARQAGVEAVPKLYGQTLRIVGEPTVGVDAAQWRQQFGVSVVFNEQGEADVVAEDGNPNRALCRHLLHLVSGQEVKSYRFEDMMPQGVTVAQLYRKRGRFFMRMSYYRPSSSYTIAGMGKSLLDQFMFDALHFGVPGDFRPALKAMCEGLDISLS